jgi:hypothetical protein
MKLSMDFIPLEATMNSHFLDFGIFILLCLLINVYVSPVWTQLLELYTFDCPLLLHISAIFGRHQLGFTITCMEKNTLGETFPSQLIYWST